jgi:SAM-dependent methyltransferase
MKNGTGWLAYNVLAWTDAIISPPDDLAIETELLVKALNENSSYEAKTILHLGCGAGGNDYTLKKHFRVTGVDISQGILDVARKVNPEIIYHLGDMRNIELGQDFDAVVVPDSIDYMRTEDELLAVMMTAKKHLKPGGMLLIVAHPAERFSDNNFVYIGSNQEVKITIFENNHIFSSGTGYEATLVYLIRSQGKLKIYTDRHFLGLFKMQIWLELFGQAGFENPVQVNMDHIYDRFIVDEGKYPQLVFICKKPRENAASPNG